MECFLNVTSTWLMVLFRSPVFLLSFCLLVLLIAKRGMLKFLKLWICWLLLTVYLVFASCILKLFGAYKFRIVISSGWQSFHCGESSPARQSFFISYCWEVSPLLWGYQRVDLLAGRYRYIPSQWLGSLREGSYNPLPKVWLPWMKKLHKWILDCAYSIVAAAFCF